MCCAKSGSDVQVGRQKPTQQRVLWVFVAVIALTFAELGWWITFNVRSSGQQGEAHLMLLERDRQLAAELIAARAQAAGPSPALPGQILTAHFPALEWRRGPFEHRALNALYPEFGVFVRQSERDDLWQKHDSHIRMFLSEGAFFLAMVMLGAALIFRTMRREVHLMRQQANFLSAVTHELKSPLASIRLYTETMQLREVSPEVRERYLRSMRQDIDRLETLVVNLLAVARLEADQFIVYPERCELVRELTILTRAMEQEMAERGVPLALEVPDAPVFVRLDPAAFATVLRNLLDNAAKYGANAARGARVALRVQNQEALLEVQDFGMGLANGEAAKIFDKFYRVGDEMVRQAEGSGLGLYLVRTLVEQCGGRVVAESAGPQQGTTLRLTFPLDTSEGV